MAPAVVIVSLALGALTMGLLAGFDTTAVAATAFPHSRNAAINETVSRTFHTGNFNSVNVSTAIQVLITQGNATGDVLVTTTDDLLQFLKIENENGILNIRYEEKSGSEHFGITTVKITMPDIKSIVASTAAVVKTEGVFNLKSDIMVDASTAAQVSFGELTGKTMTIDASSASQVYALVLDMENLAVNAFSATQVRLRGLNVDNVLAYAYSKAKVTLSGRCNTVLIEENSLGDVKTQGLIRESMPLSHGTMSQPRLRKP